METTKKAKPTPIEKNLMEELDKMESELMLKFPDRIKSVNIHTGKNYYSHKRGYHFQTIIFYDDTNCTGYGDTLAESFNGAIILIEEKLNTKHLLEPNT